VVIYDQTQLGEPRASLLAELRHRLDSIGLTAAGRHRLGWDAEEQSPSTSSDGTARGRKAPHGGPVHVPDFPQSTRRDPRVNYDGPA
jgi:hypothetical protein